MTAMLAVALFLVTTAATARATPPRPVDLQVTGGSGWHANNSFELTWSNPNSAVPLNATHYRIHDPAGTTIKEERAGGVRDGLAGLTVPRSPGSYQFEVWLEDAAGEQGPAATAELRFDNGRPGPVSLSTVPEWVGRTGFPLAIEVGHPSGPPPLSGIRGYAVAVGSDPFAPPCLAADRCTDAETTLRGGIDADRLEIADLPQGTSYLRAVAVSGAGMKSVTAAHAALRVDETDPVTRLSGAPSGWTKGTVRLLATATDAESGMQARSGDLQPFTAIRVDGGAPLVEPGDSTTASLIEEGVHQVAYYARDAAGNADDGAIVNGVVDNAPRTASVRIDRTAPSGAFVNAQDPRDPDLLTARFTDALSGPAPSHGHIGVRRVGSGDRFAPLTTIASASGELRARWESDAYSRGEYEFQAAACDLAGNCSTTTRRQNGAPMILSNPLKTTTTLSAGFRHHSGQRVVPYGRGVMLGGRLTAGVRLPLGNAPVRIVERFTAGARVPDRVSSVRTGARGSLVARAAPGPSRTVEMRFDGSPTLSRSASDTLELKVRSGVRLHASAAVATVGGAPLVFSGRLLAQPGAASTVGRSAQLQFRLAGLPWASFRTIETDAQGRFRYAYRFSDDDSRGARFQFRAYVPRQEDWPYEPGGSRPVLVRGR